MIRNDDVKCEFCQVPCPNPLISCSQCAVRKQCGNALNGNCFMCSGTESMPIPFSEITK